MATHSVSILAWRLPMDRGAWWATVHRVPDSDITEMTERAITMIMYKLIRNTADMCKEKFFVGVFYFSSQKISFFFADKQGYLATLGCSDLLSSL